MAIPGKFWVVTTPHEDDEYFFAPDENEVLELHLSQYEGDERDWREENCTIIQLTYLYNDNGEVKVGI